MKLNWSHENFKVLGIDFSLDLNCITDINFTKKIKEVKAILKSWQHRQLPLAFLSEKLKFFYRHSFED
jgi:hypothetical protein